MKEKGVAAFNTLFYQYKNGARHRGLKFELEKEYFRSQIDELRAQTTIMQGQFNTIQIAYAKEVEQSQNWEKLHRELTDKYNELASKHEDLKGLYSKLKEDFDKHKKLAK
jgi:hypothetical protein